MPPRQFVALAAIVSLLLASATSAQATQVIANWDVIPGQVIEAPFKVGVVAFHETGAHVDFFVNGSPVASADEPTWNDRTGVWEYWFTLDPTLYDDGALTLTATASPDGAGENRNLSSLTLYANANGSLTNHNVIWVDWDNGNDSNPGTELSPKKNIMAGVNAAGDGGTVYLKASPNYELTSSGGSYNYWTTVSAAPGLTAEDVKILTYGGANSTGRYSKSGIKWRNVSFYCDRSSTGYGNIFFVNNGQRMWFDECWLYDANGRWANTTVFNNQGGVAYLTNSVISDVNNSGGSFHRNMVIERIGSDIYRVSSGLVAVNVTIRVMDRGATGAHPDFIQLYNPGGTSENVILYNIKCYDMMAQGFFGGDGVAEDVAFVNIMLEKDPPNSSLMTQISGDWRHILWWNITEVDQTFNFRNTAAVQDLFVQNCVFATFVSDNNNHPEISISHAHTKSLSWNQSAPLGSSATVGDPQFVDYDNDDYRLKPQSPAYRTGLLPPGVPADVDGFLFDPASPNRGAFSEANPGFDKRNYPHTVDYFTTTPVGPATNLATVIIAEEPTERYHIYVGDDLINWTFHATLYSDSAGRIFVDELLNPFNDRRFYKLVRVYFPDLSERP